LAHLTAAVETLHTEFETLKFIDLSSEETVFRFRKSDIIGKLRLGDIPRPTAIGQQTTGIGYGVHMEALAGVCADGVTLLEGDTPNGCAAKCVLAVLACGGEKNLGPAKLALQNNSESKLGFGIADPALTGDWSDFAHNAESSSQRA
jgi:hypothetical protein